jgi:hypothetical protein
MGFWQGLNEGLTYVMEDKARKKELADAKQERMDERAAAQAEKSADRAYQREQMLFQLNEGRRDNLLGLFAKQEAEKAESQKLTGQAQAFFSRVGEDAIEDPKVQALLKNPRLAAQLEEQALALEKDMATKGVDAPPLRGQNLLDALAVFDPDTGTVAASNITLDDLMSLDMSDHSNYEQTMLDLSRTQDGGGYATIKPDAYRVADPKKLEEGRKMFDQLVLRQAQADLASIDEASGEWADLKAQIDGYREENSAERLAIQDKYGYNVYKTLLGTDNPYIQGLKSDPQFGQFSTMYTAEAQLRAILTDPEASQADKDGAAARLRAWGMN